MLAFFTIISTLVALDVYWAWRAATYARRLRHATLWLVLIYAFVASQLIVVVLMFVLRSAIHLDIKLPTLLMAFVFIWHILVLPAATLPGLAARGFGRLRRRRPVAEPPNAAEAAESPPPVAAPTRRQLLAAVAAAAPPLAAGGIVGFALHQRNEFRVREITVPIPNLPPNLDGLRIAHLSDTHVGAFTHGPMLRAVADEANKLKADLICFTGDLIDYSLRDLSEGFDFLSRLDPRQGLAMCVGNHDLFQNGPEFRRRVLARGFPLLLDTPSYFTINNEVIQIFGLDWGMPDNQRYHDIPDHMNRVLPAIERRAFPILLAHHPHAWDAAINAGIPLTLAGHTHGGQLNLTKNIGGGAMMFKYWSGLYSKGSNHLVVSNGIGNWFPLRVNAPAEIVHLTLKRG